MKKTFQTPLNIQLIARHNAIVNVTLINDGTKHFITADDESFIAFKKRDSGLFDYKRFETFPCCVAYLHGGLSADYLNSFQACNENDTEKNLKAYRQASYAVVIEEDGTAQVVSYESDESYELITGNIENVFSCYCPREMKHIDIYHDDEFLFRDDLTKLLPTMIDTNKKRSQIDFFQDVILYGKLVIVSHDGQGETIGLHDHAIQELIDRLYCPILNNPITNESRNVFILAPSN